MPAGGLQEPEQRGRCLVVLDEASAQFVGDIYSDITRPASGGIEGDDADRIFVLALQ